jgi:FAD/FMN-containing dehydrogenase
MVLANGTVVNANENENRDLWVAQRGGSGNFGLVTRFDMRAIPYADPAVPKIWGGYIIYDYASMKEEFVNRWVSFTKSHATDTDSSSLFHFRYASLTDSWELLTTISNTANIPNAPILEPLVTMDNQLKNTMRSDTMRNFTLENTGPNNLYNIWFTSTYNNDARFILYAQEQHPGLVAELRAALPEGTDFTSLTTHHAITPTVVSHSNGNNVLGLEKHVANDNVGILFLIWLQLKTAEDEAIALPIVKAWHDKISAYGTELGINWDWEYLDYAHGLQDPISKYGEENIIKLRQASKKYDPNGVFQTLRGTGFKIPFN